MKKLLWVGDAGCPSGFAKATHNILDVLCCQYDVTVLGINYRGDPHDYSYPIWAAMPGGDWFGVGRLLWMCNTVKPDIIVLQNDGWHLQAYVKELQRKNADGGDVYPEHVDVPVVAAVAVDGKNFDGTWLNGISHAIFWTQFALDEAREGGYVGPATVIPLGVDTDVYYPMDREKAREGLPYVLRDAFIVGNVNRNQPRKRWDLLVKYFATWITEYNVRDAYLYLHTAPTGDMGVDVKKLAAYYGVIDRLATVTPETFYGVPEQRMALTYNCFDVNASTTQGEGFGLTTLEAMACGVPQILPDWAALGDWAKGAAWLVPCPTTAIGPPYVNVIGGEADESAFVEALDRLYSDKGLRASYGARGLERAQELRFKWTEVGRAYVELLGTLLGPARAVERPGQASQLSSEVKRPYAPATEGVA